MKERPIPFSAPMVRAILAGRKTQTRRIAKPRPDSCGDLIMPGDPRLPCPYGQLGDRLWVKETFIDCHKNGRKFVFAPDDPDFIYRADNPSAKFTGIHWTPSIFMPRTASRLTLELNAIRIERLQDISRDDAFFEGIATFSTGDALSYGVEPQSRDDGESTPQRAYRSLWESINGPDSWDANPYVWALTFKLL